MEEVYKKCDDCFSDIEAEKIIILSCGDNVCPECVVNHPCV